MQCSLQFSLTSSPMPPPHKTSHPRYSLLVSCHICPVSLPNNPMPPSSVPCLYRSLTTLNNAWFCLLAESQAPQGNCSVVVEYLPRMNQVGHEFHSHPAQGSREGSETKLWNHWLRCQYLLEHDMMNTKLCWHLCNLWGRLQTSVPLAADASPFSFSSTLCLPEVFNPLIL